MRRHILGLLALGLVAAGAAGLLWPPGGSLAGAWTAAALRIGLVLGVLWLALPNLERMRPGFVIGVGLAALAVAWQPKLLLAVLAVLAAVAFLQTRWRLPK